MIDIAILKKARLSKDARYDGKFFIGAKTTKIFCRNVCPGSNPIGIVVPCHRVIGKNGTLTGYAGGLHRKAWLLTLEQEYA